MCNPRWIHSNDGSINSTCTTTAVIFPMSTETWQKVIQYLNSYCCVNPYRNCILLLYLPTLLGQGVLSASLADHYSEIYFFFPYCFRGSWFAKHLLTCTKYHVCSHTTQASDLRATTSSSSQCFFLQPQRTSPRLQVRKKTQSFLVWESRHTTSVQ